MGKYKIKWYNGVKYFWSGKRWIRSKYQKRSYNSYRSNSNYSNKNKNSRIGYFWVDGGGSHRQTDYQGYLEAKESKLVVYRRYLEDDETEFL